MNANGGTLRGSVNIVAQLNSALMFDNQAARRDCVRNVVAEMPRNYDRSLTRARARGRYEQRAQKCEHVFRVSTLQRGLRSIKFGMSLIYGQNTNRAGRSNNLFIFNLRRLPCAVLIARDAIFSR